MFYKSNLVKGLAILIMTTCWCVKIVYIQLSVYMHILFNQSCYKLYCCILQPTVVLYLQVGEHFKPLITYVRISKCMVKTPLEITFIYI